MKYLLVLLVILVAIHIWRSNRRKAPPPRTSSAPKAQRLRPPEDMVTCAHCGLHLPASDAVTSPQHQSFCSPEHRKLGAR